MGRFDLNDEEWAVVQPLLPKGTRGPIRRGEDDRRILNSIFYILRTGAPWVDLPDRYGSHKTTYNRYNLWAKRGIWGEIFEALAASCEDSLLFIDGTIVKAHRASTGARKKEPSRRTYWPFTRRSVEQGSRSRQCARLAIARDDNRRARP